MSIKRSVTSLIIATLFVVNVYAAEEEEKEKPFGDYTPKGFLSDYSRLTPEGDDSHAYKYRDPQVDFKKYKKLLINRIEIFFHEDAEYKGIDPTELKELTDYFYKAIVDSVSGEYEIVTEPGPDVLHLRIAVTDIIPNNPGASVVTLVVPFLWLGEAGAGVAEGEAGSTPFVGEATVEFEAMDSESHQQIAAYIETRVAKKYKWDEGVSEGVSSYVKAYSTWAYTKKAFDDWTRLLHDRLLTVGTHQ